MKENTMCHIHLTKEDMINSYNWKGDLDLLNIIMIGLAEELPEHDELYELHRLLGSLLSEELSVNEKLNIIETEYNIPMEENLKKEVSDMCNLSQGIKEKGIEIGEAKGRADGIAIGEANIILNMYEKGFSIEQIALATDKEIEDIKVILKTNKL